jgi:transposase
LSQAEFRGDLETRIFRPGERKPSANGKTETPELRERAVRAVFETGRPVAQVARKHGVHYESLRFWVRQAEADVGKRPELLTSSEREELKRLRSEVKELRRSNEILKAASAFFAKELDPPRPR